MVYVVPVPIEVPPVIAVYQFITPAEAVAPKVNVPDAQIDAGVEFVMVGIVLIVATTGIRVPMVQFEPGST